MQVSLKQIHDLQVKKYNEYQKVKSDQEIIINNTINNTYKRANLYFTIVDSYTPNQITLSLLGYLTKFELINNQVITTGNDVILNDDLTAVIKNTIITLNNYKELWQQSTMLNENNMFIKILPDRIIIDDQNILYAEPYKLAIHRNHDEETILNEDNLNNILAINISLINCPIWIQETISNRHFLKIKAGITRLKAYDIAKDYPVPNSIVISIDENNEPTNYVR